jgi:MFS family permease
MIRRLRSLLRSYDRRLWILFLAGMVSAIGFSVVFPFLGLYLYTERGVPMALVGSLFTTFAVSGSISQMMGGNWSDRLGRKRIMVTGLFGRVVAYVLLAFAVGLRAPLWALGMVFVLSSFAGNLVEPASQAMIADVVPPDKRVEAYGILRVGGNFGWALGPALGGFLASFSYASLFLFTALASIISGTLVLTQIRESHQPSPSERYGARELLSLFADGKFIMFCVITYFLVVIMAQLVTTLSVYGTAHVRISKIQVGYLYTTNGLLVALFQFPAARLIRKMRITDALALGAILYALGYFSLGFATSFLFMWLAMWVITSGEVIVSPSGQALVANLSPEAKRGRYMGLFGLFGSFGWATGPLVGGLILDALIGSPVALWGAIGSIGLAAMVGYLWFGTRLSPVLNEPSYVPMGVDEEP